MCAARVYGFTNKVVINDKGDNITNDGQDNGTVIVNTLLLPPMMMMLMNKQIQNPSKRLIESQ